MPSRCTAAHRDYQGKKDWLVVVLTPDPQIIANVWFGNNPDNRWVFDGLVRVGVPFEDAGEVWQVFQRYSDGSYRRI
jgi:hypothetical protein